MAQITVSIPYAHSRTTIRRAVDSVLNQTYRDLVCVVVNDGSPSPWDELADITDPRLVRFDLSANRGRYFADSVTLAACQTPWFTVHDADDAARPHWLSSQVEAARIHQARAVFCAHLVHGLNNRTPLIDPPEPFTGAFAHHAHMAGLWRTDFLRELGGLRPDFRVGYDTMITGVAVATGRCHLMQDILYERFLQRTGLTKSLNTRVGSPERKRSREWIRTKWPQVTRAAQTSPKTAGKLLQAGVSPELRSEVRFRAEELAPRLKTAAEQDMSQIDAAHTWAKCLSNPSLWGKWALNLEAGQILARELEVRRPSLILEAGSGTSTVLFSQYADAFGAKVIALESGQAFQKKTQSLLEKHGTGNLVEVRHAPLRSTPDGPWYAYDGLPDGIDFALVDGPRECDGGRKAAMTALLPHLKPGALMVLDDAERPKEKAALADWKRKYGLSYRSISHSTSYVDIPRVNASHTGGAKVVVTLLTGRRPALLERTLHRMQTCMPGLLKRAHVTVLHNGGDEETAAVLFKYEDIIDVTVTTSRLLDIGAATSLLAQQAAMTDRKYWLHLEDDWNAIPVTIDWLAQAQTILHTRPKVFQVRLRHHGEPVLAKHMVTSRPLRWSTHGKYRMTTDAHYTNNPSLVRTKDAEKIWPARGEREAQRNAWNSGLRFVAQLIPGVFFHTGDKKSLREETECQP